MALLLCVVAVYLFVITFIPSDSKMEINADDWSYTYPGGIGLKGFDYNSTVSIAKENKAISSNTETASHIVSEEISSDITTNEGGNHVTSKTTTSYTKPAKKPIIYLNDNSEVYTNKSFTYMHTDYRCKKLRGTIVIMTFKQSVKNLIPYCPECADTVIYVPDEEQIITSCE